MVVRTGRTFQTLISKGLKSAQRTGKLKGRRIDACDSDMLQSRGWNVKERKVRLLNTGTEADANAA